MANTITDHAERVLEIPQTSCNAERVGELATATGLAKLGACRRLAARHVAGGG